jgi:hypothetical protein
MNNLEKKVFNIENFINNFVYGNWYSINYTYKIEDIECEIVNDEELLDEEIFYKDIVYNEY